jgi:hypothetical protein
MTIQHTGLTFFLTFSLILILALASGSCSASSVTPSDQADTSPLPSATLSLTNEPSVTHQPSDTPKKSPSPQLFSLSQPRQSSHQLIFSNTTDTEQTIYSFEFETGQLSSLFVFPPEISLHSQPEVMGPGNEGGTMPITFPKGLRSTWMYLSPDGRTLATLQPARGGYPNYLHQIDLTTGEIVSLKLLENYEWTIPIAADRRPDVLLGVIPGGEAAISVLGTFNTFAWAPDGNSYVFTIGHQNDPPAQIYYGIRGSNSVSPLAVNTTGTDIGLSAKWSPNGELISFSRDPSQGGLWLIDMTNPTIAKQLVQHPNIGIYLWSRDSEYIFFAGLEEHENGGIAGHLYQVNILSGEVTKLVEAEPEPDELVQINPYDEIYDGSGLIVVEGHSVRSTRLPEHVLYVDLISGSVMKLIQNEMLPTTITSPVDAYALLAYGDPCVGTIYEFPSGAPIYGPRSNLCMGGNWSIDGHLIGGFSRGEIVVWDIDIGERTVVAEDLPGDKIFLGWVPDLDE